MIYEIDTGSPDDKGLLTTIEYSKTLSGGGMKHYHFHTRKYELVLLVSGVMYCYYASKAYKMDASKRYTVALMNINESHLHKYDPDVYHEMYHVHFSSRFCEYFQAATGRELFGALSLNEPVYLDNTHGESVRRLLECMMMPDLEPFAAERRNLNSVMMMIELIRSDKEPVKETTAGKKEAFMLDVIQFIDQNYQSDLSLETVAAHFYVSKEHLSRLFKSFTSLTVNQYIMQTRLKKANEMLNNGLSLTETAERVGFRSTSYFIESYKRAFGFTPGKYSSKNKKQLI